MILCSFLALQHIFTGGLMYLCKHCHNLSLKKSVPLKELDGVMQGHIVTNKNRIYVDLYVFSSVYFLLFTLLHLQSKCLKSWRYQITQHYPLDDYFLIFTFCLHIAISYTASFHADVIWQHGNDD